MSDFDWPRGTRVKEVIGKNRNGTVEAMFISSKTDMPLIVVTFDPKDDFLGATEIVLPESLFVTSLPSFPYVERDPS